MKLSGFRHTFLYLLAAALLIGSGWCAHDWYHRYYHNNNTRMVKAAGFRFTSPLLDVELPEGFRINSEPIPFKYKIKNFVNQQIESGKARHISVYYRDLQDGPWFGINEKDEFDPASMMKVPVMIAWLKRSEKDPNVLKRSLAFNGKENPAPQQNFRPARSIMSGRSYTVEELLVYMLSFSDNNATSLLYGNLDAAELNYVMDNMDVTNNPNDGVNSISVHGYSGFFRILYNASFLNREMSEKALQLLSLEDFSQGIIAGVPKGTVVASKFGEHAWGSYGEEKQLHEFGIVYHPKAHYILGIMTEGSDFDRLSVIIRDVSSLIYSEVDSAAGSSIGH